MRDWDGTKNRKGMESFLADVGTGSCRRSDRGTISGMGTRGGHARKKPKKEK